MEEPVIAIYLNVSVRTWKHTNTELRCRNDPALRAKTPLQSSGLTAANDEHSHEEQRHSDPGSTLKRPFSIFCAEIKDKSSCLTAANVRLSTHTYIHTYIYKCVHRETSLSCKCRIIMGLCEGGTLGSLLKTSILKRVIDVAG